MKDLIAEHAALKKKLDELTKAILDEWETMSHNVARQRQSRIWEIEDRLMDIERSKQRKNRP